jgi:GAF domain-containing protein
VDNDSTAREDGPGRGYQSLLAVLATAASAEGPLSLERICEACTDVFSLDGSSVLLHDDAGSLAGLSTWGEVAARAEAAQFVLGDGPGVTAAARRRPEMVADLATGNEFQAFSAMATALGLGAVFAFPLGIGAIQVGVLSMYRCRPGSLAGGELTDALLAADIVTMLILADQAEAGPSRLSWAMDDLVQHRAVVHQATGMISVQINGSPGEALARLRAFAFVVDRPVDDVAEDVVGRRLRFTAEGTETQP